LVGLAPIHAFRRVDEDADVQVFLLEEEFRSDPSFAHSFMGACGLGLEAPEVVDVRHSMNDEFGEADLVVSFRSDDPSGGSDVLLIENKINASFQPEQANRYRLRGESGVANGLWRSYRTVLVAPEKYIGAGHDFDAAVSLEQLSAWVCSQDSLRRAFEVERLKRAIDKKNTTGIQIIDETMTRFRAWYGSRIADQAVGFVPPAPRPAYYDDNWMEWRSNKLPPFFANFGIGRAPESWISVSPGSTRIS
ncbi:MAG: hypothetical protein ABL962_19025, partial [Fimbriimonadaceae bacterium]